MVFAGLAVAFNAGFMFGGRQIVFWDKDLWLGCIPGYSSPW